jgi:hypothetical protein
VESGACRANSSTHTQSQPKKFSSAKSAFTQIEDGIYDDGGARTPGVNSNSGYESSTSFLGTCHVFVHVRDALAEFLVASIISSNFYYCAN